MSEEFLDINIIRQQAITMGNGAHELRNFLAMTKKQDLPELIAIDNLAAQVENQARQFVQISQNPTNLLKPETGKTILRSIYRANNFFLRNLKLDIKDLGYSLMSNDLLAKLIENIELQQKIVKNLDKQLNSVFNNYLDTNVNIENIIEQFKDNQLYKSLNYNIELNLSKSLDNPSLDNLIESAKNTCNKAHSIQNSICVYQVIEKVKNPANQINNLSGNIENQFRAILQALQQQLNNPNAVKQVFQNQTKAAAEQINQMTTHRNAIAAFYPQEMKEIAESCEQISLSLSYFQEIAETKLINILS